MKRLEYVFLGIIIVLLYSAAIAREMGYLSKRTVEYKVPIPDPADAEDSDEQLVTEVLDGDTIVLSSGRHVRYIGINAPEIAHERRKAECFGSEATKANADLVLGKRVRLVSDITNTDKYGRLLRYVYEGDIFINTRMVSDGFAYARPYAPDVAMQMEIEAAELAARKAKRGVWRECL